MKKITTFLLLLLLVWTAFAKKDINAWKQEPSMEQQYEVFKQNLNFWNGSYFLKEDQLNDFYGALNDSILLLEKAVSAKDGEITKLRGEINTRDAKITSVQTELDESLKLQNSIVVFGLAINKNVYSIGMYLFIIAVLALAGFVFLLYKRSITVTRKTKKDYDELKEEYEAHKKSALDRYTKINMELHRTRMELKKK